MIPTTAATLLCARSTSRLLYIFLYFYADTRECAAVELLFVFFYDQICKSRKSVGRRIQGRYKNGRVAENLRIHVVFLDVMARTCDSC